MKKINIMLAAAALTMGMMGAAQAAPYAGYADKLAGVQGNTDSNVVHLASGVKETTSTDSQSGMANYEGLKKSGYWCSPTSHDSYLTNNCGEAFATDKAINKILTTYDANDKFLYDQINGTIVTDEQGKTVTDDNGNAVRTGGIVGTIGDLDGLRPNVKDYLLEDDPTVVDAINANSDALAAEVAARKGADAAQDKVINQINQNVADGFTALSAVDAAEAQAREAGDAAIWGTIGDLDGLRPNVKDYLLTDDPTVVDAINANSDALAAEVAARKGADAAQDKVIAQINQNVADGFTALNAADAAEAQAREAGDAAEAAAREAADKTLQSNIDAEAAAREAADKTLQDNIDAEAAAREAGDAAEKAAREAADAAEKAAREAADATLQNNIDAEAQTRAAADAELQSNIDRVDRDSKKGIARAVALAGLHPLDYDPDNKLDIAAAGGFYKNQNAFAIGAFYRPNRNVMVSFGTSVTGSDDAYNVGVSFKVGRSGEKKAKACPSTEDLYAMLSAMQEKIDAQQARIEELEAK